MSTVPPLRQPCPAGLCDCDHETLRTRSGADRRILLLTAQEERRLLQRLEGMTELADLHHMLRRMEEQLGLHLEIHAPAGEVRSARGLEFQFAPQPGLCRKTRQAIPAAIRRALRQSPSLLYALLDSFDLLGSGGR